MSCTPGESTRTIRAATMSISLGLNGLGACATQYSSEYMDVEVLRDGFKYQLHFEDGKDCGRSSKNATSATVTRAQRRGGSLTLKFSPILIYPLSFIPKP